MLNVATLMFAEKEPCTINDTSTVLVNSYQQTVPLLKLIEFYRKHHPITHSNPSAKALRLILDWDISASIKDALIRGALENGQECPIKTIQDLCNTHWSTIIEIKGLGHKKQIQLLLYLNRDGYSFPPDSMLKEELYKTVRVDSLLELNREEQYTITRAIGNIIKMHSYKVFTNHFKEVNWHDLNWESHNISSKMKASLERVIIRYNLPHPQNFPTKL
jgi:hypothetical protein